MPVTQRLTAAFSGSARAAASTDTTDLRVTKVGAAVRVKAPANARTSKPVALRVSVAAAGQRPSGRVVVSAKGKVLGRATLRQGATTLKVRLKKPGTHTLQVRYLGDATTAAASSTLKVKVRKR